MIYVPNFMPSMMLCGCNSSVIRASKPPQLGCQLLTGKHCRPSAYTMTRLSCTMPTASFTQQRTSHSRWWMTPLYLTQPGKMAARFAACMVKRPLHYARCIALHTKFLWCQMTTTLGGQQQQVEVHLTLAVFNSMYTTHKMCWHKLLQLPHLLALPVPTGSC